ASVYHRQIFATVPNQSRSRSLTPVRYGITGILLHADISADGDGDMVMLIAKQQQIFTLDEYLLLRAKEIAFTVGETGAVRQIRCVPRGTRFHHFAAAGRC
ncbi:hypothetical protein, partial [Candidatus Erwinia dacicola]